MKKAGHPVNPDLRRVALDVLIAAGAPVDAAYLSAQLKKSDPTVRALMRAMVNDDVVKRLPRRGGGWEFAPTGEPLLEAPSSTAKAYAKPKLNLSHRALADALGMPAIAPPPPATVTVHYI